MSIHLWPDVSNQNGHPIDAFLAKAQGMSAICAKATEGTGFVDKFLAANYQSARAAGLPFMAYHYPHSGFGAAQAQFFLAAVERECGTLDGIALLVDREDADAGTINDLISTLSRLAPGNALVGYEAAWVVAEFGPSPAMASLPLVWPNYVDGSGTARALLAGVAPGWFEPFGGHRAYAARQYTSSASVGGISPCDVNVCFDDIVFAHLFGLTEVAAPTPTPVPVPLSAPILETNMLALTPKGPICVDSDGDVYVPPGSGAVYYGGLNHHPRATNTPDGTWGLEIGPGKPDQVAGIVADPHGDGRYTIAVRSARYTTEGPFRFYTLMPASVPEVAAYHSSY